MSKRVRLDPDLEHGEPLSHELREVLRQACGLDLRRAPYRNRTAYNLKREGILKAAELEGLGLLVQDRAEHYGMMRVYRVTASGFRALGLASVKSEILAPAIRAAEAALRADNLDLPFGLSAGAA